MKKVVIAVTLMSFFFVFCSSHYTPPYESETAAEYENGYIDGKVQASRRTQSSLMWGGCGGSLVLGLLGGGIVTAIGYNSGEYPPFEPKGTDTYKRGFIDGFQDGSSDAKGKKALSGCLVGTLINVAAIVLIYSLGD